MINFRERNLNQQKPQFEKFRKYPKKCMKTWNKMQKEGQKGLTGLWRGNLAKNPEENDKKLWASLV